MSLISLFTILEVSSILLVLFEIKNIFLLSNFVFVIIYHNAETKKLSILIKN